MSTKYPKFSSVIHPKCLPPLTVIDHSILLQPTIKVILTTGIVETRRYEKDMILWLFFFSILLIYLGLFWCATEERGSLSNIYL